ncbi:MAG: helix-turn-helix transcriptional regulator [Novosphingobium sp.]
MTGSEKDAALIAALTSYARVTVTEVAKKAKVDPETLRKPMKGKTDNRLSQRTIEKLQAAYPAFPGWNRASDERLPYRHEGYATARDPEPVQIVEVAHIDLNFGLGGAFMDSEIVEYQADTLPFPRAWLRQITTSPPDQLYWTHGVGNSMEPAIGDGDVILIDRSKVGSTFGDLYWAIAYGQTGMIKRLRPMPDGSVKILSDNPAVPPEVAYDGELHIFGRVIAVVKNI